MSDHALRYCQRSD